MANSSAVAAVITVSAMAKDRGKIAPGAKARASLLGVAKGSLNGQVDVMEIVSDVF